jgi:hypothetical protein
MILIFKFYQIEIHPERQTGKVTTVTVITLLQFSTEPIETLLCKCGNTVTNCNWIVENFTRWAWNCRNNVTRCAWNFENVGIIYAINCGNTATNGWKRGNTATKWDGNYGRKATICARKCGNTAISHVEYCRLLRKNNKSYGKHCHKL